MTPEHRQEVAIQPSRRLTRSWTHEYITLIGVPRICYVRIYEYPGQIPAVLVTDPRETGGSVEGLRGADHRVAAQVVGKAVPERFNTLGEPGVIWIEHFPNEPDPDLRFRRVMFHSWKIGMEENRECEYVTLAAHQYRDVTLSHNLIQTLIGPITETELCLAPTHLVHGYRGKRASG